MAEESTTSTEAPEAETTEAEESTATESTEESGQEPSFEGDFDAERAARLVKNLRDEKAKLKAERDKLAKDLGVKTDAEKSELQRIAERAEKAEAELAEAQSKLIRGEIAAEFGVPADVLGSGSADELKARAKAIAELVEKKTPAGVLPRKPRDLASGGGGDDVGDFDATKAAARIRASL